MSITTEEAIAEARKYLRTVQAFEKLAEVADALANGDQLIMERERRLDELLVALEAKTSELNQVGQEKAAIEQLEARLAQAGQKKGAEA